MAPHRLVTKRLFEEVFLHMACHCQNLNLTPKWQERDNSALRLKLEEDDVSKYTVFKFFLLIPL